MTFTFIACGENKKIGVLRIVCGADAWLLSKLQLVTFDPFCFLYASLIVNEIIFSRDNTKKITKLLSVECIVRCKQLSIKLLDKKSPASSSFFPTFSSSNKIEQLHKIKKNIIFTGL